MTTFGELKLIAWACLFGLAASTLANPILDPDALSWSPRPRDLWIWATLLALALVSAVIHYYARCYRPGIGKAQTFAHLGMSFLGSLLVCLLGWGVYSVTHPEFLMAGAIVGAFIGGPVIQTISRRILILLQGKE